MRLIASIVLGLALTVAPARADDVEQVPIAFMANAVCDISGSPCVVTRKDIIETNIAIFTADALLHAKDRQIEELADQLQSTREDLAIERLGRKYPRCGRVEKIPVPGTRS